MADHSLPETLKGRDRERLRRYKQLLAFYQGDQWLSTERRRNRRLTLNYAKATVNKATSYLMTGRTVTSEPVDDTDAAAEDAAAIELAINQVWDQNRVEALDFDTELDCAVLGDAAYKVWWDTDQQVVRISSPDPAGIFAWRWPDDPSRTWRIANRYRLDTEAAHETLPPDADLSHLRPGATNWITEAWTLALFEIWVNNDLVLSQPNPYDFIPFVIFPNIREPQELWGTSDIPAIQDAQRELNREFSQLSLILELSGNPVAVLEGVNEAQDIAVAPGAVWELPGDAKAYLLDLLEHGGVKLHIDYLEAIYRAIHDLGETPRSAFGETNQNISGVALELALDPIVKKVARKRTIRTDAYRARNEMILRLLNRFADTEFAATQHDITWGNVLPIDRERDVRNEALLVESGIHSRAHATDVLGEVTDPDAEFARVIAELRELTDAGAKPSTNGTPTA